MRDYVKVRLSYDVVDMAVNYLEMYNFDKLALYWNYFELY